MSDSGSVGNAHERALTLQPLTLAHSHSFHVSVNEARLERKNGQKGWEEDLCD